MSHSKKHIGRKIAHIRELRGLKQEALAYAIGLSQQTISNMEKSEKVDEDKLEMIAKELDVSVEAIKNFSEEGMISYLTSFNDINDNSQVNFGNDCSFNPLDKLMDAHEEIKRLYQLLVDSEKEKNVYLERLLKDKEMR